MTFVTTARTRVLVSQSCAPVSCKYTHAILASPHAMALTMTLPVPHVSQDGVLSRSAKLTRRDTTMTFTTFVMFDMFNALCCRSADKIVPRMEMLANKAFLYSVGGSIVGQVRFRNTLVFLTCRAMGCNRDHAMRVPQSFSNETRRANARCTVRLLHLSASSCSVGVDAHMLPKFNIALLYCNFVFFRRCS